MATKRCAIPTHITKFRALLAALARRVKRIEIVNEKRRLNNVLRGFESLEVTLH